MGDFPPSSKVTVDKCFAAAFITTLPILGLPVKQIWSKGSSSNLLETLELPSIKAISFSSNNFEINLCKKLAVFGTLLEDFNIMQFPAAMAPIIGPIRS